MIKLDPFFMLRRRWIPEHSARVFDGRRKPQSRHTSMLTLWVIGVIWMLIVSVIVLGIMRTTEAVSRTYWPEAAAMLEGGK